MLAPAGNFFFAATLAKNFFCDIIQSSGFSAVWFSASALGAEGREFKSHNSDYFLFYGKIIMKKFIVAMIFSLWTLALAAGDAQAQINYQAYAEGIGWMDFVNNGETAGTTGQSRRLEGLLINLKDGSQSAIQYCAHVQNYGWMKWKNSGEVAGVVGKNLRTEAVRIKLVGNYAARFDIYYRAHVANYGWLGWAKNGEPAGTAGASLRMEAVQIQIVPKGANFERGGDAFYQQVHDVPTV